jgi:hypothetical protein
MGSQEGGRVLNMFARTLDFILVQGDFENPGRTERIIRSVVMLSLAVLLYLL